MSRRRTFLSSMLGLLLVVLFAALYATLRSETMGAYVREKLITVARDEGIPLRIERVSCGLLGCSAETIDVLIPHAFSYLRVDQLSITPHLLGFISGAPEIALTGKMYGGAVQGVFSDTPSRQLVQGFLKAEGLQASELPQLSGIGISGGSVDLEVTGLKLTRAGTEFESSTIRVSKASKPQKTSLSPLLTGAPIPIDIPAVTELNLLLTSSLTQGRWQLAQAELSGSFGKVSVKGEVTFSKQPKALNFTGRADLTPQGVHDFSMFGAPPSPRFEFRIGGNTASPDFNLKPLP